MQTGYCGPIFFLLSWTFFPTPCKWTLFPSGRYFRGPFQPWTFFPWPFFPWTFFPNTPGLNQKGSKWHSRQSDHQFHL